mgnify:FL=1
MPLGYNYSKLITINGTTSGAQTNYQMKLAIIKGAGSDSAGTVYLNNHAADWPEDIRFVKSDGITSLDFWREEYDTADGTWWVEFDSIPISPGTATFYMYYGKVGDTDASNGANTFLFFDDFPGVAIDGAKWTPTGNVTVASSICTIIFTTGGSQILNKTAGAATTAIRSRLKSKHYNSASYDEFAGWYGSLFAISVYCHSSATIRAQDANYVSAWAASAMSGWDADTYHIQDIIRNSSTNVIYQVDH